jgi:hypothetical protein
MPLPHTCLSHARKVRVWRLSVNDKKRQRHPPYLNPKEWRVTYHAGRKGVINREE